MSDKHKHCYLTAVLVLVATVVLCFSGTLRAGFVSDDFVLVHRVVNEGFYPSWGGETGSAFFRPLTVLSFVSDHRVWGTNSTGFHLTNLLWHCLAGFAVFLLFRTVMQESSFLKPCLFGLLTGVLFLSLSSHSESVSWISGRTDIIATALALLSLFLYYHQLNRPSMFLSSLALALFSAGLMAKESVIVTPLLWGAFLVYRTSESRENLQRNIRVLFSSVLIAGVYLTLRITTESGFFFNMRSGGFLNLAGSSIPENLIRYIFRVFIPPLPAVPLREVVFSFPFLIPAALLLLLIPSGIALHRKATGKQKRILFLLIGCFLISLLPVLSLKVSLFDTQSERFLYLPSVFAAAFFTVAVISLFKESKKTLLIISVFILIQGVFLHRSNRNWDQAGRICSSIAQSLSEYESDSVLILAVPDSYNGAYVFRNGLNEAVAMLNGERSDYIVICMINSYGDSLSTDTRTGMSIDDSHRIILSFTNGRMEPVERPN